jgi:predicted membrane protein
MPSNKSSERHFTVGSVCKGLILTMTIVLVFLGSFKFTFFVRDCVVPVHGLFFWRLISSFVFIGILMGIGFPFFLFVNWLFVQIEKSKKNKHPLE